MQLYLDSSSIDEITAALDRDVIAGVTTNPSIIAKAGITDWLGHVQAISQLPGMRNRHLSVELTTSDIPEMYTQARKLVKYNDLATITTNDWVIKVPMGWSELKVISDLHKEGIRVNVTACMATNQCIAAALAGADYVSIFWGRIRDKGYDASSIVRQVHKILGDYHTQIIVGSIRQMIDVCEALDSGADIVTVPYKILQQMCANPITDEVVGQFMLDGQKLAKI